MKFLVMVVLLGLWQQCYSFPIDNEDPSMHLPLKHKYRLQRKILTPEQFTRLKEKRLAHTNLRKVIKPDDTVDDVIEMEQAFPKWPDGPFALPEPWEGCPVGGRYESFVYQDNDDTNDNVENAVSPGYHILLYQDYDYTEFSFCNFNSVSGSGPWPNGSYCIVKLGTSCPSGFKEGYLFWDDENDNNDNRAGGNIPAGTFDSNTLIKYCCRSDGDIATPISLPNVEPYLLLRQSADGCQQVQGMSVSSEWVFTDDENDCNLNQKSGSIPYVQGIRDFRVYYCYYTPQ